MKRPLILPCAATAFLILGGIALAQEHTTFGDPAKGRAFAVRTCTSCHLVAKSEAHQPESSSAPTFDAIANQVTTTASGLRAFLSTPHANMPNLILTDQQQRDVIAYIMSLKR